MLYLSEILSFEGVQSVSRLCVNSISRLLRLSLTLFSHEVVVMLEATRLFIPTCHSKL